MIYLYNMDHKNETLEFESKRTQAADYCNKVYDFIVIAADNKPRYNINIEKGPNFQHVNRILIPTSKRNMISESEMRWNE